MDNNVNVSTPLTPLYSAEPQQSYYEDAGDREKVEEDPCMPGPDNYELFGRTDLFGFAYVFGGVALGALISSILMRTGLLNLGIAAAGEPVEERATRGVYTSSGLYLCDGEI